MAINKIQGNILADNLQRGSDLAIQGNLIYFDVAANRVGVLTSSPQDEFNVIGVANVSNLRLNSATINCVVYTDANKLETTSGNLTFDGTSLALLGNLSANNITASETVSATGNVTGGNLITVGEVTATGNITGGNVNTAGEMSATGNVTGNVGIFADILVGNINLGNLISNGNLQVNSLTANAYVSAIGNVVGGNLVTSNAVISATVSASGNIDGGNINTSGDISAAGNITAANFSGTGNISLGNITISNTTISTALAQGNVTLTPTGDQLAIIDTTTGLVLPVGNTVQRPPTAVTGTVRFNTTLSRVEIYDGSDWEDVVANVTAQVLYGDNSTTVFTLDRNSTAPALLVAINGVIQLPSVAYSVAGNQITFAQAPVTSDVIDIRFL